MKFLKKMISKHKISSTEILDTLYLDCKINESELKYKKLKTQIGYIDNMIKGKNNNIPNTIIHAYFYLNNKKNSELAWESLNTQFDLLIKIIRIWLLDETSIE
ncbi:hypothetical protein GL982_04985 [Spiroplasma citri]|uniref:Uncharacterized protein n=1 Tax=Spiroplasma citri TaxID=2133 RepID=A0AAJ4JYH8_SPICI|nr:hypothetical protein [Spiroplasma citri]APE74994.1 hypothetical protein SCITRI_001110 [Spiroplasma citri]QIA69148.1 hypothetical protein GL298_06350 [Spiroplasma citri]QIA71014.1 hypothetical protein GL981_06405 [Spiroplasma citri]QIA73015.1 hypothetical protein GL982_04985 [Spiroplasma citri]QIA75137.1 hypothetical protein GTU57_05410 [Spiroplasma citri]